MPRAKPFNPASQKASDYLEMMRRREAAAERREIDEAMAVRAAERDPAQAGVDIENAIRQSDIVIDRDSRTGNIIRAERLGRNVFCQLGRIRAGQVEATLSQEMVDAGNRLIEIYAAKHGLAGSLDDHKRMGLDRVDGSMRDHDFLTNRMHSAIKRWGWIMAEFGPRSRLPALFELLCQDAMETDHTLKERDSVRWRAIVARVCEITNRNAQGALMAYACRELVEVLRAVEGVL
jgi:hypothetical protein